MAKIKNNKKWHGTDANIIVSLFEYGLLVRYVPEEKSWQCLYRNPNDPTRFSYGWKDERDLKQMFLTDWARNDLLSFCSHVGVTWKEWLERPVAVRIHDVFHYYGALNIFGEDYSGGESAKDVCKALHIKYQPEYEAA